MSPVTQGTVGLGAAIAHFTAKGLCVSLPLNDNQGYDLIVDDGTLKRVQVKTTLQKSPFTGEPIVNLKSVRANKTENKIWNFDPSSVELLYVKVMSGGSYLIPTTEVRTKTQLVLDQRFANYRVD